MPSFSDSAVIFFIALLLFGPKKLPELARYLGKLMGEFRRASSEFRLQMEDEFRVIEQAEQTKKIAAIEAAAPIAPLNIPEPEHPHMPAPAEPESASPTEEVHELNLRPAPSEPAPEPLPIASSGEINMMPPSTGLPVSRSSASNSLTPVFDAIPHTPAEPEASTNG